MDESNPLNDQPTHYGATAGPPQYGGGKKRKTWLIWTLAAVLLIAIAVAMYLFFFKDNETATTKQTETTQSTNDPSVVDLDEPDPNATEKSFKSETMNIEFTYRSDWKLKESSDKQQVTLTSPRVAYTTAEGQAAEGVFTVKLRHGVIPDAMQETVAKTTAVKDSLVIAYSAPTSEQRQYTNVSYGGTDAQTFGYFIVTGSTEYKTGQVFGTQINLLGNAYLFVGGYGADASDALAFDPVPAASFDTDAYQQAQKIIESLKIY